jgi:hypothetical protein
MAFHWRALRKRCAAALRSKGKLAEGEGFVPGSALSRNRDGSALGWSHIGLHVRCNELRTAWMSDSSLLEGRFLRLKDGAFWCKGVEPAIRRPYQKFMLKMGGEGRMSLVGESIAHPLYLDIPTVSRVIYTLNKHLNPLQIPYLYIPYEFKNLYLNTLILFNIYLSTSQTIPKPIN